MGQCRARAPPRRRFTLYSQGWPRAQLCLTGLWPVATLVNEALSAGFADVASTAIPAHSEAKATPLLETCSASVASLRIPGRPSGIASGKDAQQQRVPWVRHRQEAEAGARRAGPLRNR